MVAPSGRETLDACFAMESFTNAIIGLLGGLQLRGLLLEQSVQMFPAAGDVVESLAEFVMQRILIRLGPSGAGGPVH